MASPRSARERVLADGIAISADRCPRISWTGPPWNSSVAQENAMAEFMADALSNSVTGEAELEDPMTIELALPPDERRR